MNYTLKIIRKILFFFLCFLILGSSYNKCIAQVNIRKYEEKKNVKKLISVAQNKSIEVNIRGQAISALGRLNDVRAVEPLINVLKEKKDITLQLKSIAALGKLKDSRAAEPLIAIIKDKDFRKSSIKALDNLGGEKVLNALVAVLTDSTSLGRELASTALERLGWKPTTDVEKAYFIVAKREWDNCLELGNIVIEPLIFTLTDGVDNAKIGAFDTLERIGWIPGSDNVKAYDSVKALKLEMAVYREGIVRDEMKYLKELESVLEKLKDVQKAGDLNLSNEEFMSLEKRITLNIKKEIDAIDDFRSEINKINLRITKFGNNVILGNASAKENVTVFRILRSQNGLVTGGIWRHKWTGKKTKEFEWEGEIGNFYRFDNNGDKYLFAKYYFTQGRKSLKKIDFVEATGNTTEIIYWSPFKISTKIKQDKWIDLPVDINFAIARLMLIEVKSITKHLLR